MKIEISMAEFKEHMSVLSDLKYPCFVVDSLDVRLHPGELLVELVTTCFEKNWGLEFTGHHIDLLFTYLVKSWARINNMTIREARRVVREIFPRRKFIHSK